MRKRRKKRYGAQALTAFTIVGLVSMVYLIAANLEALSPEPTDVKLFARSAWPEHYRFDISLEEQLGEDAYQTLYAQIKNYKNQTVFVQAKFFINPTFGTAIHYTLYTDIATLNPDEHVTLTADFGPLTADDAGTYYVTATCLYSLDGKEWIASDVKEFKFTIVP
jgi:hypothetical protein